MPKNIVVFSDGTGQEGGREGRSNTNVYKLFNMVENRTCRQVVFYDRGLGTGFRKVTGNVSGMGISRNIKECYRFIFNHYQAGDQIYLFGFSRGATTVRSLSGFMHLFGILPKSRPELIKQAYAIYKIGDEAERRRKAAAFNKRHHTMWCTIRFLGVWDSVAALGLPIKSLSVALNSIRFFKHKYHNLRLSESVEHARHALAVDDRRLTFHPEVWDKDIASHQTMKQVWFSGMHTDVGGGYPEQGLADITLQWMMREAMQEGLRIYSKHTVALSANHRGVMHDSRTGFPGRLYREKGRFWDAKRCGDRPVVHESVKRRADEEPTYDPWILKLAYDIENESEEDPAVIETEGMNSPSMAQEKE